MRNLNWGVSLLVEWGVSSPRVASQGETFLSQSICSVIIFSVYLRRTPCRWARDSNACAAEGISPRRKWGSIVNPPELGVFLQRGGDSKPNQWGAQTASWTWWKFGAMGIGPGPNYGDHHNGQDDTCAKPKQNFSFRTEMSPCRSSLAPSTLYYFQHYFRDWRWASKGLEPNWRAASSTVRFVAVISKPSPRPVVPVFLHQPHLDPTGLSPNSPFGPIIHDRRRGHYGIKGKAWNPKEAITLGFNCVSSKCQSTPDVWESSASL